MPRKRNLNEITTDGPIDIYLLRPGDTATGLNNEPSAPMLSKKKSCRQVFKETYFEYCSNSSIDGILYFGQHRPWREILLWACVLIVSVYFSVKSVEQVYDKWNATPVIVSFSETSTGISKIPFPAVTICAETKRPLREKGPTYADLVKNLLADGLHFKPNITANEHEEFLTLLHVCDTEGMDIPRITHPTIDYNQILSEMAPDVRTTLPLCKWSGRKWTGCSELFTTRFTEDGICFTFNGLLGGDLYRENTVQYKQMGSQKSLNRTMSWSLESGYAPNSPLHTYPSRVFSSGAKAGLAVTLQSLKQDIDYGCRGATQGFKLLLHSPDDVPLVSKEFVRIPLGKEISISVKPNMMETSDGIAMYSAQKRQCYLNSERPLKFFKTYSENNCERECLTNYTLNKCGCVKFSMPRTADMPVCAADKIHCYAPAEDDLLSWRFSERFSDKPKCNCVPACTSMEYDTEISRGNFDFENALKADRRNDSWFEMFPGSETSRLTIYFKDNEFNTCKRSQLYSLYDLLANWGGLCALFISVSIVSIIEIFYHLTLRLWTNMKGDN